MFLKFDPYRVWCSIFYSKLVNCILFKIIVQHVRFVKGRGTCGSEERNVKIWIDFRKSPRFSLTSPLSQEREKSSRPDFTMCGEPWHGGFFIVLAIWNNSLPHSDTLSRFRANQSLFFLLNDTYFAEKQQIPILLSLVLNQWSIALEASTGTIISLIRFLCPRH
jgi:hypothetical protein